MDMSERVGFKRKIKAKNKIEEEKRNNSKKDSIMLDLADGVFPAIFPASNLLSDEA